MTEKDRKRVKFDRQDTPEQPDDAPTVIAAAWDVTLDGKKVGQLRKLQHRTEKNRVEYALFENRGKKADMPEQTRKLDAITAVRDSRAERLAS